MKRAILILTAIGCFNTINAQESKGYFGLSFGPSFPVGHFSSADIYDNKAGFAEPGIVLDLSFARKFGESNFGITALLRGQRFTTNEEGIEASSAIVYPGVDWQVTSDAWQIGGLMTGLFGSFPVRDIATFEIKGMIGLMNAQLPPFTLNVTGENGNSAGYRRSEASETAFSYLLGIGFNFNLSEDLLLLTNLDYQGALYEYWNVRTIVTSEPNSVTTWKISTRALTFNVGVGLKL